MKKNGFIMSTYVYILLVFFLLLLGTMLVVLNNTRLLANKIKDNKNVNVDFNLILKGDKEIILKKDSEYIEPGYIATTFDGKKLDVNVMGEVNVNKLGEYDIIYIAEYKGVEKKIRRKVIVAENLVTYITNLYKTNNILNNLKKDNTPDSNIRYYGSDPNNYVRFNNELWRIIGVFGNNVKLVRSEKLGNLSWDSSESSINSGWGVNEWSQSDLKNYLNTMYYGGTEVTCYGGRNNQTTTCPTGTIDETSKSLIDNHTWNTGAIDVTDTTIVNQETGALNTVPFYNAERGNVTGKICSSGNNCNDTVERTTEWPGYIGLPYPTDYAYASSESDCETNMNAGYNATASSPEEEFANMTCKKNNWMHHGTTMDIEDATWFMSPGAGPGGASGVWFVSGVGLVYGANAAYPLSAFPTIYLKSNILIESGKGTSSNPYILKAGS